MAICFIFDLEIQTRYKEIPISAYNIVQTGPKIKLGGEKKGLWRVLYQKGIEEKVNIDPNTPALSQRSIENISSGQFLIFGTL